MNPIRWQVKIYFGAVLPSIAIMACMFPQVAYGTQTKSSSVPSPTADMTAATFKMLASLAFIVGIIIVVFYLLRRLKAFGTGKQLALNMRIVASLPIAPKRSVTVVEVGGKWLILGVGTESINLLSTMEAISESSKEDHRESNTESSFQKILRRKKVLANQVVRGDQGQ